MGSVDSVIVAAYFVAIFVAGYAISRRHAGHTADEFVTGGRTQRWYENGLALLGMAVDPGYMSIAALGFLHGLYLTQWTGVHVWFTTWFAAMFFIPVYWRSRIVTTPEFLEKRFNVQCRVLFSLLMVVMLIATLGLGLYLGALLLQYLIGWPLWQSVAFIAVVTGFYVMLGGMQTVLVLDVYQAIFLLVTLLAVGAAAIWHVGGVAGLASIQQAGEAGVPAAGILPPSDWSIATAKFFPRQAIVVWATLAGLSWLACNFGMAQRLLAARSERDAQKSLLLLGGLAAIVPTCSFLVGVAMRHLHPQVKADEAFVYAMLHWFGPGVRGLLAAGMMAALLSTADGLLTGSSALLVQDVYVRFVKTPPSERTKKNLVRALELATLIVGVALVAVYARQAAAMAFLQALYADVLGVIVAVYLVGMFSTRATPRATLIAMLAGIAVACGLEVLPRLELMQPINFAYVGAFSLLTTVVVAMTLSRFEPALPAARLENLTIHTLPDARGPWVGLTAWPALWKWALTMAAVWFGASAAWQWYVMSR